MALSNGWQKASPAPPRTAPTTAVAKARRYASVLRIVIGATGAALLAADPGLHPHPLLAALGCLVIVATGLSDQVTGRERWLRIEEPLSCLSALTIVGAGEGQITALTLLWMASASVGMLARGGRVGNAGRILMWVALLTPVVTERALTADMAAQGIATFGLLMAISRISVQTTALMRDPLTGVLARAAFFDHVDRLLLQSGGRRHAALIMVDLDDFGTINKTFGHQAGDALLVSTAQAIQAAVRHGDVVGRIGGDEFAALVFSDTPLKIASAIVTAVGGEEGGAKMGASAGVARWPRDGACVAQLVGAADVAMLVAKRDGKDHANLYTGASLTSTAPDGAPALLDGLCRGVGIEIFVQPIVELTTGRATAYEALARFRTDGTDAPQHWLALSDALGRRSDLEFACLRAALDLLPSLPEDAHLTVNLSGKMLTDARALTLLRETVLLERLVIEITEEKLVSCQPAVVRGIAALRAAGARFAVDDVGVGYAGLGQIAVLRPEYLKLDRSLVRGIDLDPPRARFIQALADYGRDTGCLIVAEGVETPGELAEVRRAGVPLVQGFLVGKPAAPWPAAADAGRSERTDAAPVARRGLVTP